MTELAVLPCGVPLTTSKPMTLDEARERAERIGQRYYQAQMEADRCDASDVGQK